MYPKHICWWCKEKFEEYNGIRKYKSGWLCDQCKAYLETQSGEKEQLEEGKMTYKERKDKARQEAIEWQNDFCNHDYFMSELAAFADYFGKQAKRYGLTKEFRENGII